MIFSGFLRIFLFLEPVNLQIQVTVWVGGKGLTTDTLL